MTDSRRQQVDRAIEAYRHLTDRLLGIHLPAARAEREVLEKKLMALRQEKRALAAPSLVRGAVLRGLGRTDATRDTDAEDSE